MSALDAQQDWSQMVYSVSHLLPFGNGNLEIVENGFQIGGKERRFRIQNFIGKECHVSTRFFTMFLKGGIENFRPFPQGEWIHRKWWSQILDWKMNILMGPKISTCLFLIWLGTGGKPGKKADRCLPPWNLAAKTLFQSFPMSGSLWIWVKVNFAQIANLIFQTWKVTPSVYFKCNNSLDCQSCIKTFNPTWNILILVFRDILVSQGKYKSNLIKYLRVKLIPLEVVSSPLLEVFKQRTIWQGVCHKRIYQWCSEWW